MTKVVPKEEYEDMAARLGSLDPDKIAEFMRENSDNGREPQPDPQAMVMLGGQYELGGVQFPPLSMGAVVLLQQVGSPFLSEDAAEAGLEQIAEALFCLANSADAVNRLMRIESTRARVDEYSKLAKESADHLRVVLEWQDKLAAQRADFQCDALEFWDALGVTLAEAAEFLEQIFADALQSWGLIPNDKKGQPEKKD